MKIKYSFDAFDTSELSSVTGGNWFANLLHPKSGSTPTTPRPDSTEQQGHQPESTT